MRTLLSLRTKIKSRSAKKGCPFIRMPLSQHPMDFGVKISFSNRTGKEYHSNPPVCHIRPPEPPGRIRVVYHHVHLPCFRPPEISPILTPIPFPLPKLVYYLKRTHFHPQTVPLYLSPDTGAQRHCISTCPLYPNAETPQLGSHTDNTLNAGRVFP
jgi:hypothetical protein